MKRILTVFLIFALSLTALCACGGDDGISNVDRVAAMYSNSSPKGLSANTTQYFGDKELRGTYTLVTGTVDGKAAAVYTAEYQRMRTVEEGATSTIVPSVETVSEVKEYIEGKGVRVNKTGQWDATAPSIIPERGAIALNLDEEKMENVSYSNHVLSFSVKAENTESVLGTAISADVSVRITDDGALITGVNLAWTLPANEEALEVETFTEIDIVYSYDYQKIDIA